MTKQEVAERVRLNGKPLDLDLFSWDEKTSTFSSNQNNLVFNFKNINYCVFNTGDECTFHTGDECTFHTGSSCTFDTMSSCTFDTMSGCTFDTMSGCTFDTMSNCIFKTESNCTFKTESNCTLNTGSYCTFDTDYNCTFDTGSDCTLNTGSYCSFDTGSDCTFDAGSNCTFNTESYCTFDTWDDCIFNAGSDCIFNIYKSGYFTQSKDSIATVRGYSSPCIYNLNDYKNFTRISTSAISKPIIDTKVVDRAIMVVLNTKHIDKYTIYKTQYIDDYFDNSKTQFVAEYNEFTAHGESLKQAIYDVEFKIQSNNVDHIKIVKDKGFVTPLDYRILTGACSYGVNQFLEENNLTLESEVKLKDLPKLVKNQFGFEKIQELLKDNV